MSERHPDSNPDLSAADRELEAALMSLRPMHQDVVTADALFEAGRRAGPASNRQLLVWRGVTCLLAMALAGSILFRPGPTVIERERVRIVFNEPPEEREAAAPLLAAAPPAQPLPSESMYALRQVVLERGIEHLPASHVSHLGMMRSRDVAIP
jgi:hypothetical protein